MSTDQHITTARIEADPELPIIRITRDFHATAAQLHRAHTDPDVFAAWVGPHDLGTRVERWDATRGGAYRFVNTRGSGDQLEEFSFYGSFHEVRPDRIVQTFTWEGVPDGVSLDTMTFEDLGDGWTRMHSTSLLDSFEARAGMLASGMEPGVNEGYESLDALLAEGKLS